MAARIPEGVSYVTVLDDVSSCSARSQMRTPPNECLKAYGPWCRLQESLRRDPSDCYRLSPDMPRMSAVKMNRGLLTS